MQPQSRNNGSLDEWLSQRSAKPCTAVRIRQEPPNSKKALPVKRRSFCRLLIPNYLPPLPILNKIVRWQDHSPKYNLPPQYGFLILPIKEKSTPPFFRLSGNFWLVSFKISYLCLPLFHETRTTPSCHPSGCAYRQL